ncbi:MAG: translation elongation factor-like protein [Deltaproteobacteria bacterium]|nr:MAG: translation elongation factor-like protein [Deltaproteobacteria bacterium]
MEEKRIGTVIDYFAKIGVVAIHLEEEGLKVGDTIHIKGHTTDFTEEITSMQIERNPVQEAKVGDDVGIKVKERARKRDVVYKVID